MEDVLVLCLKRIQTLLCLVLILVVMEDVLVQFTFTADTAVTARS